jgi:hypothetical protein
MESQAVNVAGAGLLGSALIVAGAAGVASNHKAASSAPSKAPEGVDPVLHQESVLHAAMIADPAATPEEFNKLNELVLIRKKPR